MWASVPVLVLAQEPALALARVLALPGPGPVMVQKVQPKLPSQSRNTAHPLGWYSYRHIGMCSLYVLKGDRLPLGDMLV